MGLGWRSCLWILGGGLRQELDRCWWGGSHDEWWSSYWLECVCGCQADDWGNGLEWIVMLYLSRLRQPQNCRHYIRIRDLLVYTIVIPCYRLMYRDSPNLAAKKCRTVNSNLFPQRNIQVWRAQNTTWIHGFTKSTTRQLQLATEWQTRLVVTIISSILQFNPRLLITTQTIFTMSQPPLSSFLYHRLLQVSSV